MTKQKNVAIIFGGASSEYEISLLSSTSILKHIPIDKYNPIMVGITKEGKWMHYTGPVDDIRIDKWQNPKYVTPAFLAPDPSFGGLIEITEKGHHVIPVDVIFPVLHGKNGEDGTIQGLFELCKIPYVGCNVLSSAVCMDKGFTHSMLDVAGIANAKWTACYRTDLEQFDELERQLSGKIGYPMYVKPANAGSSVGVNKASNRSELHAALDEAFLHDRKAIVEETIVGHEVECAVLGNYRPIASLVGEIVPKNTFYSYEAKYKDDSTELFIPARISDEITQIIRRTAVKAYRMLGCTGLARVDFFVTKEEGKVILNEVNTLPGFTSISMYPKLFEAAGIPYPELIDRLISFAFERE